MYYIEENFSRILKYMGIPKEQIHNETSFVDEFGFEEFQFTCLAFYIGIYFKINVREREYGELITIGSTKEFIKRKLNSHEST